MLDYSRYPDGNRYYSGAERKKSILISEKPYLVKFQKKSREGLRFNHVSEYLGSHIFSLLGIETQETFLGTYKDENVVVIQDFLGEDEVFVPFNGVGDSSLEQDKEKYQYSYEDIIEACKQAQIHDYINSLPTRYETFLEEKGSNLSGGQKQRLAIARAIIKKPEILIMDEATTALNPQTTYSIIELLKSINKKLES